MKKSTTSFRNKIYWLKCKNMEVSGTKKEGAKSPLKLREDFDASNLYGLDLPAVVPLVPDTGK